MKRGQQSGERNGGRNRNSKSPAKGGGFGAEVVCLRCGSKNHTAGTCPRYTTFCKDRCSDCTLYHETKFCNQRRSNYKSPGRTSQKGRNGRGMDKIGKRVNALELQDDVSNVIVEQNNDANNATTLSNNLFRKN